MIPERKLRYAFQAFAACINTATSALHLSSIARMSSLTLKDHKSIPREAAHFSVSRLLHTRNCSHQPSQAGYFSLPSNNPNSTRIAKLGVLSPFSSRRFSLSSSNSTCAACFSCISKISPGSPSGSVYKQRILLLSSSHKLSQFGFDEFRICSRVAYPEEAVAISESGVKESESIHAHTIK